MQCSEGNTIIISDNEEKPWHKPTLEINLSADYNIQENS